MITFTRCNWYDTWSRHVAVTIAGRTVDVSIVALSDEGGDVRALRILCLKWGKPLSLFQAGFERNRSVSGVLSAWKPVFERRRYPAK